MVVKDTYHITVLSMVQSIWTFFANFIFTEKKIFKKS